LHHCPFKDHTAKTREALQLHLKETHQYDLVSEFGKDWAVSEDLESRLEAWRFHHHIYDPCRGKAASSSESVNVSDQTVMKDQELIKEVTCHFCTSSDIFCCHLDSKTLHLQLMTVPEHC